jgi:hypothetical protein
VIGKDVSGPHAYSRSERSSGILKARRAFIIFATVESVQAAGYELEAAHFKYLLAAGAAAGLLLLMPVQHPTFG